jgi:hypothetical protein
MKNNMKPLKNILVLVLNSLSMTFIITNTIQLRMQKVMYTCDNLLNNKMLYWLRLL